MLRNPLLGSVVVSALLVAPIGAAAQQTSTSSDSAYIAKVTPAAPAAIVSGATIVQLQKDGTARVVQTGTDGFTCMLFDPVTPMCADKNAMAWGRAYMTHAVPPDDIGFVYMLAGDNGASNIDPFAKGPTPDNHWVKTGPHVMIVGQAVLTMGYPATPSADPTKPYVMWAGTPYAHVMIPVVAQP